MAAVLDLIPAVLFVAAYAYYGLYTATAVLIVACFALVAVLWLRNRRVPKMQLAVAVVAGIFGGLTLALHDPEFIKIKPTVFYAALALALLASQFIGDKVLLARIPQAVVVMPDAVWRRVNLAWVLFFVGCAVLNLYVATHYSEATWVKVKAFGFSALMFAFLLLHAPFLSKYFVEPEAPKA
jgi:intracellular septation protein